MCGFCGYTGSLSDERPVLSIMMDKIIHRGPDSDGQHLSEKIAMGFRRLSIIDLQDGSQPMYNEDGSIVLVFNGEIYNYQEIRAELIGKGHIFSTRSDTEVIVHGYEEYGFDILQKLRGMFAFALWDEPNDRLFCARDFFGIKPFYYSFVEDELVFGSEIKSILAYPKYEKKINEAALEQYLSFQYSVLPETFFKNIYKLMPAHYLVYENNHVSINRYWEPVFEEENLSLEESVEAIDNAMQDSIKAHKVSDVEVGSFLSSGVDSSYVASCFNGDKTFTVGFDYEDYNEIGYAKTLSETIGIENFHKVITKEEYWDILPTIQYHMDEPLADPSCVALYFVSNIASQHVKVALSGEGADELFGGYNIYKEPAALSHMRFMPMGLRRLLGKIMAALPFSFKGKNYFIRAGKTVEERFIGNANMFSVKERKQILKQSYTDLTPQDLTAPYYQKVAGKDDVTKMQYIDIHFWLIGDILLKADKMSMANSLEVRVPFLDKKVMETAAKIPLRYRVNAENTKYAMRQAAGRHLPEAVAKKKKLGFPVPIRIWLREEKYYNQVKEAFAGPQAEQFFQQKALIQLLDEHKTGKKDHSRKIWTIYIFLVWYGQYFDEKAV